MLTVLIMSFYELKESLKYGAQGLEELGYKVINYPLFQFAFDQFDKKDNCLQDCINFIEKTRPDVIFWWCINVSSSFIEKIHHFTLQKDSKCLFRAPIHLMYTWDDPFNFTDPDHTNKIKYFDILITCCKQSALDYFSLGKENVEWHPPGFEASSHFPIHDDFRQTKWKYDVSFCLTNLYEYSDSQLVKRIDIINAVRSIPNIRFAIFGPEFLGQMFPENYQGQLSYHETNTCFNESCINLNSHVISNQDGYVNERNILILASGGLMLVDDCKGLKQVFQKNKHCLYYDSSSSLIETIQTVLQNPQEFNTIRSNGYQMVKHSFQWKSWANVVHMTINKFLFDPIFYQKHFLQTDDAIGKCLKKSILWKRFLQKGFSRENICYRFRVPISFDDETYRFQHSLNANKSKEFCYWHCLTYNKHFLDGSQNIQNNQKCIAVDNTSAEFSSYNDVQLNACLLDLFETKDWSNFKKLKMYAKRPDTDLNHCLEQFLNVIF